MNLLVISGHLTENPQTKVVAGDKIVLNNTIAHNDLYTNKDGQKCEETIFHSFEAWGGIAETIAKFVTTKRKILLSGRVKQDRWEKDGVKHSKNVLVVDNFEFMDSPARAREEAAAAV